MEKEKTAHDLKHTTKKLEILQMPSQSHDLNLAERFPVINLKAECRMIHKEQLKVAAVKAEHSFLREESQHLVTSMGSRLKVTV